MQRRARLLETPKDLLFSLKDIIYIPETPRKEEPFTVKGKVELFGIPFLAPIWVIAKVTYPEEWWEEIIPIIGSPTVGEGQMALGGDFEVRFPRGFDREGEFLLDVEAHAGPTYTIDKITLPPFPPVASEETTFIVGGEVPPEEAGFRNFRILSYSKNGGTPVTPPGVLTLNIGDRCRVNVGFDHRNGVVTTEFHAAIGNYGAFGFDEILNAHPTLTVPASTDWAPWEGYIDIAITSAISPGTYDMYAKIMGITGGDIFSPVLENAITIAGAGQPQFSNLQVTSYDAQVQVGGTCLVKVNFQYQGPAISKVLYAAIGNSGWAGFDEIIHGQSSISIPESQTPQSYQGQVSIAITSAIDQADSPYDLYAKINGILPAIISPTIEDVIYVEGAPSTESPEVETLDAENVTSYGARIGVELIDTGYVSNVDVYCQFGKTTAYEMGETPKHRMYSGDEGEEYQWDLSGLEPNTTYHFRAAADPVGDRPPGVTTTYGADKTFRTEEAGTLEVYKTRYYYNGSYYDEPHVINIGDEVGVQFNYQNVSGKTLSVFASLTIYSWGYSAGRIHTGWEGTMPADDTRAIPLKLTADVISEWTARLILEADGEEVLDTTIVIGYCPPF